MKQKMMMPTISEATVKSLFDEANRRMTQVVAGLLNRGVCTTVHEATSEACRLYGKTAAASLENTLRMMGAQDVKVTCP